MPAMTRAERTIAKPASALIIAALPVSIWRGLPEADMYMKAPHIRRKAATVTPTPTPTLSKLVKSALICGTWIAPKVAVSRPPRVRLVSESLGDGGDRVRDDGRGSVEASDRPGRRPRT